MLLLTSSRYPSLLESSDVDGGSSVAVLTYLRRILDVLDHQELIHMILDYLLALSDYSATAPRVPRSPAAAKRRQSLMLLSVPDKDDDRMNPSLFNLVDLILGSTESHDSQTVIAALKLATVILGKHHGYAVGSIVKTMNVHQREPHRTFGVLNTELDAYLSLAVSLAGEAGVDESYENHLKDKLSMLESHPCSLKALALPSLTSHRDSETGLRTVDPHYLVPEDPLFKSLLDLLLTFLTNDVETNLALTEAIVTLATCSQLRLEGWLAVDPADYHYEDPNEGTQEASSEDREDVLRAGKQSTWNASATPPLLACLQSLRSQIDALRADIRDWDDHVGGRKHVFRTYEEMSAITTVPQAKPAPPTETAAGSWNPQIPRYMSESSTTPSRTASPRGRKEGLNAKHTPSTSPAPSKLSGQTFIGSPSRGISPMAAPRATPANRQTTLMTDVLANLAEVNNNPNLQRRIRFRRTEGGKDVEVLLSKYQPPPRDDDDGDEDAMTGAEGAEKEDVREASLGHIITNVVVLQEFVLELVALMQIRAGLFNEVLFT